MAEKLTISGFSTALFSTWIFVEQLGLLFDAGDGVCAGLLQKSRKVRYVAITHPDRDHVTGILQLQQLNAQNGFPQIFYPADCGSFPALAEFCRRFDPGRGDQLTWTPVKPGDVLSLGNNLKLTAIANEHFHDKPGQVKSLSFIVTRETRKLQREFAGLPQTQIAELSRAHGSEHVTEAIPERLIGYSGDTNVAEPSRWFGCKILIHESTFLSAADAGDRANRHHHSSLEDVLRMAKEASPKQLVLMHFSSRYSKDEITEAIRDGAAKVGLNFPLFAILPGDFSRDILATPVWSP